MGQDYIPSVVNPKDHTLLIVDDEVDLREVLAFSFKRAGFKVLEASNGVEAFEIVKSQKVDLVVSDIQMPGGNGVELLDNIRTKHHELPVLLFLTGFADITVEDAYNKGAEALFSKPFDFKVILSTVLHALEPKEERWKLRHWRGETALLVELKCGEFDAARTGKVINLGRGGFFVASDGAVPKINDLVEFKIHFTEGPIILIEGHGTVKWIRPGTQGEYPPGYGVEFLDLSDDARGKVVEVVNFLKTKQYIPKG